MARKRWYEALTNALKKEQTEGSAGQYTGLSGPTFVPHTS